MIEQGEWRVVHALDEPVAADGPPKAGTNIRNLEGMCELANALTAENKRLRAGLERIANRAAPVEHDAEVMRDIARDTLEETK